eukprot:GHVH01000332.1.p1 GENE.GHVH01000332.1~~GHVH01000332.1.p1  ORF type:complete len:696 (-),score=43.82 GHVH01000332.1:631-2718(-)
MMTKGVAEIIWLWAMAFLVLVNVVGMGMAWSVGKLGAVHIFENGVNRNDETWRVRLPVETLNHNCPHLELNAPLLQLGSNHSRRHINCSVPGTRKSYKGFTLREESPTKRIEEYGQMSAAVMVSLNRELQTKMNSRLPRKSPQRLMIFASDISAAGFIHSLFLFPYRLLFHWFENPDAELISVDTYYGSSNCLTANQPSNAQCPRRILVDYVGDPLVRHLIANSSSPEMFPNPPLERVNVFNTSQDTLLHFLSEDLSRLSPYGTQDCLEYYLETMPFILDVHDSKSRPPFAYRPYTLEDDDAETPPSAFFGSILRACGSLSSPDYLSRSSIAMPIFRKFSWLGKHSVLGVSSNSPVLRKLIHRWSRFGDVLSPSYYQNVLTQLITATMYWYMVPLGLWTITAFCSSAPISLVHLPRMALYLVLAVWRNFGLLIGCGKIESYLSHSNFDFSDHIVFHLMQLMILTLELAAIARSISVIHGAKRRVHSRLTWAGIRVYTILTAWVVHRATHSLDDDPTQVPSLSDLLDDYPGDFLLMIMLGRQYSSCKAYFSGAQGTLQRCLRVLVVWPVVFLVRATSKLVAHCIRSGLMSICVDLFGDSDKNHIQNQLLKDDSFAPEEALTLKLLYGASLTCLFFIGVTLYSSFYTALFFHTRAETILGLIVGLVGLYVPTMCIIVKFARPEGLGLIEHTRKEKLM